MVSVLKVEAVAPLLAWYAKFVPDPYAQSKGSAVQEKQMCIVWPFIEKTLYTKYAENALKIKGNNLSQEEKKEVYSNAAAATRKLLRQEFSKEEVMSIIRLERQSFKK